MAQTKKPVALNPNAPEFYPKQPILQKPKCLYPPKTMFRFNNHLAYEVPIIKRAKSFQAKPIVKSCHFRFCNRKCLPPRLLKKQVYVQKNQKLSPLKLDRSSKEAKLESPFTDKSSVMIRNIPNNFGRSDLLRILDEHCWRENKEVDEEETLSSYDFLYLPMDFVKHANLGYAFVNFTSSVAAEKFRRDFDNFFWNTLGNKKYCQVSVAKFQGKEELSKRFKESRFFCHTDDYLPVVLSPPSDGFTSYSLTILGYRTGTRGGGTRRRRDD